MRFTVIVAILLALFTSALTVVNPASASTHHRLPNLSVNHELTGNLATRWTRKYLYYLHAPRTQANIHTMKVWFIHEGTPHNYNNPLNLATPMNGSWSSTADGDPLIDHIQAYHHPHDSVLAFAEEMTRHGPDNDGSYHFIVQDLRSGRGMLGDSRPGLKNDLYEYSGGGYNYFYP